jgi:hypothetical protein
MIETGEPYRSRSIRLNGQILEVVGTHRILGLILERQLITWRPHIETIKPKCRKRLNLLRHLAGTQWGAGQSTLLRVHKMLVLSTVELGSAKNWTPSTQQGIALGAFCINRTQNLLIEAGESTLQQRQEIKTANMAVKITTKPEHPINRHLKNKNDKYGLRPSPTIPFFVRAKETCSMLEVDLKLKDVDQMVQPELDHKHGGQY